MSVVECFSQPLWHRLSLTLVHFLWQGLAVAVFAGALVRLTGLRRGNPRYVVYLLAFAVMAICPPVTFIALRMTVQPATAAPGPVPQVQFPPPVPRSILPEVVPPPSENDVTVAPARRVPLREGLDDDRRHPCRGCSYAGWAGSSS